MATARLWYRTAQPKITVRTPTYIGLREIERAATISRRALAMLLQERQHRAIELLRLLDVAKMTRTLDYRQRRTRDPRRHLTRHLRRRQPILVAHHHVRRYGDLLQLQHARIIRTPLDCLDVRLLV